jgi:hypothetical protein
MSSIAAHIVTMRQRVCPRTSYATSGSAASTACAVVEPSFTAAFMEVAATLVKSGEFEDVLVRPSIEQIVPFVSGNIVVLFGYPAVVIDGAVNTFLAHGRSKLVMLVQPPAMTGAAVGEATPSLCSKLTTTIEGYAVVTCFNYRKATTANRAALKGFNGQPSVQSGTQFQFLWSPSTPQVEGGKDRVLQRLADKTLHSGTKLTAQQWDALIRTALGSGLDDYGIYSLIREKTLGTSLEHDLEAQVLHGVSGDARPGITPRSVSCAIA